MYIWAVSTIYIIKYLNITLCKLYIFTVISRCCIFIPVLCWIVGHNRTVYKNINIINIILHINLCMLLFLYIILINFIYLGTCVRYYKIKILNNIWTLNFYFNLMNLNMTLNLLYVFNINQPKYFAWIIGCKDYNRCQTSWKVNDIQLGL